MKFIGNKAILSIFGKIFFLGFFIQFSTVKADWKTDANARIEQHRKRNAQITVLDQNSNPIAGLTVQIEQVNHRFAFGTAISYSNLLNNAAYRNFILSHFNWAVCENETKWGSNEPTRDNETYTQGDYIYNWCNNNGIKMRGHCLFWEQVNSNFPSWVQSLSFAAYPASSDLLAEVDERINSAVNHYKNKFRNWDIDNEMLTDNFFYSRLGSRGVAHMFSAAKAIDSSCGMFMNEYSGNSFGSYSASSYISRFNTLISRGAAIDGLGIQAHVNSPFQPETYWNNVLKPLGTTGRRIWATEFDTDTTDEAQRAADLENFFRICFSDPNVDGIMMWGFMVGTTWRASGLWGIVSSDGVLNAAGTKYEALINEWTTNDSNYSNINGKVNFRGFHGTYEITLWAPGQSSEIHQIELEPGTTTAQFSLLTDLLSPPPDLNAPNPNPLVWATAPALSGTYSIAMTASTASDLYPPVQYYFECTNHSEANSTWQLSPAYELQGLNPSTLYSFRVRARDSAVIPNMTEWSTIESVMTQPPRGDVEILGSWTSGLSHAKENGSNRALIFIAHDESTSGFPNLLSVTYGGQEMTKIYEISVIGMSYGNNVAAFILTESGIAAATSDTFIPSWSVTPDVTAYNSVFVKNVDQTEPIFASDGDGTASGNDPLYTDPVATNDGDMVILGATCGNLGSYTLENNFIEVIDQQFGNSSIGGTAAAGYKAATGVSETPKADFSGSVDRQCIIGFVLKAGPASWLPATPNGLFAIAGNQKIALNWDNTDDELAGYNLYRSTDPLINFIKLNSSLVNEPNYIDINNVTNGVTYYYKVRAIDTAFNESADSNGVSARAYRLAADINGADGDGYIDYSDLYTLADYWLINDCAIQDNCNGADFEPVNGSVDFGDFSKIALEWMQCNDPQNAGCLPD